MSMNGGWYLTRSSIRTSSEWTSPPRSGGMISKLMSGRWDCARWSMTFMDRNRRGPGPGQAATPGAYSAPMGRSRQGLGAGPPLPDPSLLVLAVPDDEDEAQAPLRPSLPPRLVWRGVIGPPPAPDRPGPLAIRAEGEGKGEGGPGPRPRRRGQQERGGRERRAGPSLGVEKQAAVDCGASPKGRERGRHPRIE